MDVQVDAITGGAEITPIIPISIIDTTQADFEAGSLDFVEIGVTPGSVQLVRPVTDSGVLQLSQFPDGIENLAAGTPTDFIFRNQKLAQSFVNPNSEPMTISAVALHLGGFGTLTDVRISLQKSAGGGLTVLQIGVPSAEAFPGEVLQTKIFNILLPTEPTLIPFSGFDVEIPAGGNAWLVIESPNGVFVSGTPTQNSYANGKAKHFNGSTWVDAQVGGCPGFCIPENIPPTFSLPDLTFAIFPIAEQNFNSIAVDRGPFNGGMKQFFVNHVTQPGVETTITLTSQQDAAGSLPDTQTITLTGDGAAKQDTIPVTVTERPFYKVDSTLRGSQASPSAIVQFAGIFQGNGFVESRAHDLGSAIKNFSTFSADVTLNGQTIDFFIRSATTEVGLEQTQFSPIENGALIQEPPSARFVQWLAELKTTEVGKTPLLNSVTLKYTESQEGPAAAVITVPTSIRADESVPVKVLVINVAGDPVVDEIVEFSVTDGNGTLSAAQAVTDALGFAEVTLTAGSFTSISEITANITGLDPVVQKVLATKTALESLAGLPTTDNGRSPNVLALGNERAFSSRADFWGRHWKPDDAVRFAKARQGVKATNLQLYSQDFSFRKIGRWAKKTFNSAVNLVRRAARAFADAHLRVIKSIKKVAKSTVGQAVLSVVAVAVSVALASSGIPLTLSYGPNGFGVGVGYGPFSAGATIGNGGKIGWEVGLNAVVGNVGYGSGGLNANFGAGYDNVQTGLSYNSKDGGLKWNATATAKFSNITLNENGWDAGVNIKDIPGVNRLDTGPLEKFGLRDYQTINIGGDYKGKVSVDYQPTYDTNWARDKLKGMADPKFGRFGDWGVEKFGNVFKNTSGWIKDVTQWRGAGLDFKAGGGGLDWDVPSFKRPAFSGYDDWKDSMSGSLFPRMPKPDDIPLTNLQPSGDICDICDLLATPVPGGGVGGMSLAPTAMAYGTPRNNAFSVFTKNDGEFREPTALAGLTKNPVSTLTGNLTYSVEDFFIPGRRLHLQMVRFYNSQNADKDGPFGFGWDFNYGMKLKEESNGTVRLSLGDGGVRVLTPNGSGGYTSPPGFFSTFAKASDGTFSLRHKHGTTFEFDGQGVLQSITDPNGYAISLNYSLGRLQTLTDPANRALIFTYNAEGRIASVTDGEGRSITYTYDAEGNLIQALGPATDNAAYGYDENHNMTSHDDPRAQSGTRVASYEYDEFHRVTKELDGKGVAIQSISYLIDAQGLVTANVTDGEGATTVDRYDGSGRWTSRSNGLGETTSMTWDETLNLTAINEPDVGVTRLTYDGRGNRLSVKAPMFAGAASKAITYKYHPQFNFMTKETSSLGTSMSYGFDGSGNLVSITDPDGEITNFTRNGEGRVTEAKNPNGNSTIFTYDIAGNLATVTNPEGGVRVYVYDELGRLTRTTSEVGDVTKFDWSGTGALTKITYPNLAEFKMEYAPDGTFTREIDENGGITAYSYDENDRLTKVIAPDGTSFEDIAYDAMGRMTVVSGAGQHRMELAYDAAGRLVKNIDASGAAHVLTYDGGGRMLSLTDGELLTQTFEYDPAGRLSKTIQPGNQVLTLTHNADGRLTKLKNALGKEETFRYTTAGQLKSVTDAENKTVSFTYDPHGNMKTMTDGEGFVRRFEFDKANRLTVMEDPAGNRRSFGYDAAGRVIKRTDPGGGITRTEYNGFDRPTKIIDPLGGEIIYEYDASGRRNLSVTDQLGRKELFTFNALDEITTRTDALGNVWNYDYDIDGNPNKITLPNGGTVEFVFDAVGRPISIKSPNGDVATYKYDKAGRLIEESDYNGGVFKYEFNALDNLTRVQTPGGSVYSYVWDANSNMTKETGPNGKSYTYVYSAVNRLDSAKDPLGNETRYEFTARGLLSKKIDALGGETSYVYDNTGMLSSKTDALGNTTRATYNADGMPVTVTNARGAVTRYEFNDVGQVTATVDPIGARVELTYDAVGNKTAIKDPLGKTTSFVYDENDRLTSETDPLGSVIRYEYDELGAITATVDQLLNRTLFAYDLNSRATSQTDPDGGVTLFEYDANGNKTKVTDSGGAVNLLSYTIDNQLALQQDAEGNLTNIKYTSLGDEAKVTLPGGDVIEFAYDELGRVVSKSDPNGGIARFSYDRLGRLTESEGPDGKINKFGFDLVGRKVLEVAPDGSESILTYDESGNLLSAKGPDGSSFSFSYDLSGRQITETDPLSRVTRWDYNAKGNLSRVVLPGGDSVTRELDDLGRVIRRTDGLGRVTIFSYDSRGNIVSRIDAAGHETRFTYDTLNRRTVTVDPLGNTWGIVYDLAGNIAKKTDGKGAETLFEYDGSHRLVKKTDPLGGVASFEYDARGNLINETAPDGRRRSFEFDANNRRISLEDNAGNKILLVYDEAGNEVSRTDANGNVTTFEYDDLDQLTKVTDAIGGLWVYRYQANRRLGSVTDANGGVTRFGYDAIGQITSLTDPIGNIRRYVYDLAGNRTKIISPDLEEINYSFDKVGRLITIVAEGETWSFDYDDENSIRQVTNGEYTVDYLYDASHQLTSIGYESYGMALAFNYDGAGNRTQLIREDGSAVDYSYNALDRLVQMSEHGRIYEFSYDPTGHLTNRSYPNGVNTRLDYDSVGRLVNLTHKKKNGATLAQFQYGYDANGNRVSISDHMGKHVYAYDALDRLVTVSSLSGKKQHFSYDSVGNRVRYSESMSVSMALARGIPITNQSPEGDVERVVVSAFDAAGRILSAGDETFTHDASGRLLQSQFGTTLSKTFDYDRFGRPIRVSGLGIARSGEALPDSTYKYAPLMPDLSFSPSPLGSRIERSDSQGKKKYLVDATANVLATLNEDNSIEKQFVHAPGIDSVLALIDSRQRISYILPDGQGSTALVVDLEGDPIQFSSYEPYGRPNPDGPSEIEFRFTGREFDQDSQLQYNRARYMSNDLGRWISEDPLREFSPEFYYSIRRLKMPKTLHTYVYVENNPINNYDASGLLNLRRAEQDYEICPIPGSYTYVSAIARLESIFAKDEAKTYYKENFGGNIEKLLLRHEDPFVRFEDLAEARGGYYLHKEVPTSDQIVIAEHVLLSGDSRYLAAVILHELTHYSVNVFNGGKSSPLVGTRLSGPWSYNTKYETKAKDDGDVATIPFFGTDYRYKLKNFDSPW